MSDNKALCNLSEIPEGGSRALESEGEPLFAVKKAGQVYLYRNDCPHDYIPLNQEADEFLDASRTLIECANHGALFTIETGDCVAGPCLGDCLEAVPFKLENGFLYRL